MNESLQILQSALTELRTEKEVEVNLMEVHLNGKYQSSCIFTEIMIALLFCRD